MLAGIADNPTVHPAAFPRAREWYWLAAGLCLLYVFWLGVRGLNEPDEGRYANIAMAMAQPGGDWWEPRESGFGHYDKPPLIYWATALSFRVFGFNEWAARLPSLFGAAIGLAGLGWAAARLYGRNVAWWAVAICGTTIQFWVVARVLSPDQLVTGWCMLAIAAWAECRHRGGAWGLWLLSLLFWVLAWWTKGTPALIPLAGLAIGTWATRDRVGSRALRAWLSFAAILVLGSPWYVSMLLRYPELSHFFFGRELAGRMLGQVDARGADPLWYYAPVCLVGWLPWWPLSAYTAYTAWRARSPRESELNLEFNSGSHWGHWTRRLGVEGWVVIVGIVIFSLTASKLVTYPIILTPWAALLMARPLAARLPTGISLGRLAPGLAFSLVALVGIVIAPPLRESRLGPNCTLRAVCSSLRAKGARQVDADHYWPGMEFYLDPGTVHYVRHISASQRERASDPGLPPSRFIDPMDWLGQNGRPKMDEPASGDRWLVRFRRNRNSPFDGVLTPKRVEKAETIGDFDLFHVQLGQRPGG